MLPSWFKPSSSSLANIMVTAFCLVSLFLSYSYTAATWSSKFWGQIIVQNLTVILSSPLQLFLLSFILVQSHTSILSVRKTWLPCTYLMDFIILLSVLLYSVINHFANFPGNFKSDQISPQWGLLWPQYYILQLAQLLLLCCFSFYFTYHLAT